VKRFRRHSRRPRRPVFWIRACFENSMLVQAAHTSVSCDQQPVLSIDEIAPGNPEFSGEDRKYTVRDIRLEGQIQMTTNALSTGHMFHM